MTLIAHLELDAAELLARHPPRLAHPLKRYLYERASGAPPRGVIRVTRWEERDDTPSDLGEAVSISSRPGVMSYGSDPSAWHLNFADPALFFAYGGPMFAQDEVQVAEHPILGSVREALAKEGWARTTDGATATPVLVRGVERRLSIDTTKIYGRRFTQASPQELRAAVTPLSPPTISNILAIAAPSGGRGRYRSLEIESILATAYTGFSAAREESAGARPTLYSGFWGCGAFGGDRVLMALSQMIAARWAGVDLVLHTFDASGEAAFTEARARYDALAGGPIVPQVLALGREWGVSDGN